MKKKTLLFVGDSITAGFHSITGVSEYIIINKGVSGDSTVECMERISEDWFRSHPDMIFLCIGTNDLARGRSDELILTNIQSIVKRLQFYSGSAKIYLTTIFPTRENEPRPNERINGFNKKLHELSDKLGCSFFDLHQHFTDEHGMLKNEYTDDGLHLTEDGYIQWRRVLLELVNSISTR